MDFLFYTPPCPNRLNGADASLTQYFDLGFVSPVLTGKTKQDARKTRRTRISRRERTYAYVTKGKRKLDAVFRLGFRLACSNR